MKTIKVSDLTGAALDFAVAKAMGFHPAVTTGAQRFERLSDEDKQNTDYANFVLNEKPRLTWDNPVKGVTCPRFSTDWAQGGPIIDRIKGFQFRQWLESHPESCCEAHIHNYEGDWIQFGPTPLIAAMRCYVASKLGDTVKIPEELI